jgi:hypothetical protein
MANSNQLKYIKDLDSASKFSLPSDTEKVVTEHAKRLELLEMHADHTETLLNQLSTNIEDSFSAKCE